MKARFIAPAQYELDEAVRAAGWRAIAAPGPQCYFVVMDTALAQKLMTAEEFAVWAEARPEKHWELFEGAPELQQSQSWGHAHFKFRIAQALDGAIVRSGLKLFLGLDGIVVKAGPKTAFLPDVVIFTGTMDYQDIITPDPIVAVEVLSPSTQKKDFTVKLRGYFDVPTIQRYLIVNWEDREIIHHYRSGDGLAKPSIVRDGLLRLAPPGIEIAHADIFRD